MTAVRNLSIRVPWHDRAWDGHVCSAPLANSSCLALKLISENRRDSIEAVIPGEAFDSLSPDQTPPCLRTSAAFLSRHPHNFESVMAYSNWSKDHKHIRPRTVHLPAWGAMTIPYRWMLKEGGFEIAAELELDAHQEREPGGPDWLGRTSWIQGFENQQALLNAFAAPLVENESLVFFYATRIPLCDDDRRVLLGAALLQKKHDLVEYPYDGAGPSSLRAMVWERPIQHSLRPAREGGGFTGGFVMPYQSLLPEFDRQSGLDPVNFVAFIPDDVRAQFSYGSEHVGHGAGAAALMGARATLERTASVISGPWNRYIEWIDQRLSRLWKLQGPAPGLGVVLSALHAGFNGTLFAMALSDQLQPNSDPWPLLDAIFSGQQKPPPGAPAITQMLRRRWQQLQTRPELRAYLKLLARFELTKEQVLRALAVEPKEALNNPYTLFERDRVASDSIAFGIVDRGLYPGQEIASVHPLPTGCNELLAEYDNEFRLRAACAQILEECAAAGHTILPAAQLEERAQALPVVKAIPLNPDTVDLCRNEFASVIAVTGDGSDLAVQLDRYVRSGKTIADAVKVRLAAPLSAPPIEWRKLVDENFGPFSADDIDEERARVEKAGALSKLAQSRVGVLIGPAGTGKTTVLKLLLKRPEIIGTRVRLLAPTGKARVRLGQETGQREGAQTVAQFLLGNRFDPDTGRYFANERAPKIESTTCIIDESSMLTEDMLEAVIDALPQTCRLILVGDPYQLPPIGAGCPFVDIIEYLKRDHGARGVGELATPRRQAGDDGNHTPALARADVQLASIFSGRELEPGEDEIVVGAINGQDSDTVKYRSWNALSDLPGLLEEVLADELKTNGAGLISALEQSLGAHRAEKSYLAFGRGCAAAVESWQILTVNRNTPGGSLFLNRRIKEQLRSERLNQAIESSRIPPYRDWLRFVKPRGPEQIVYGDKVICVRNHRRAPWLYGGSRNPEKEFVANGEIGLVTGQMSKGKSNPPYTHVEFAERTDRNFSFRRSDFSEDGQPYLELAYAITVHKAQGSEFGSVILVLPAHSRLVSREMIYTALTRQKRRVWILHQGSFDMFLALRQYAFSDIAARFTNLLRTPRPQAVRLATEIPRGLIGSQRQFLEERLIHRTVRGEMVSSKNELAIANILYALEKEGLITYQVEPKLPFADGTGRWADFAVEANGESWYWEHCGMMADANYRDRWLRKKQLYERNGYSTYSAQNLGGRLIVTEDGAGIGLDSQAIEHLARGLWDRR